MLKMLSRTILFTYIHVDTKYNIICGKKEYDSKEVLRKHKSFL